MICHKPHTSMVFLPCVFAYETPGYCFEQTIQYKRHTGMSSLPYAFTDEPSGIQVIAFRKRYATNVTKLWSFCLVRQECDGVQLNYYSELFLMFYVIFNMNMFFFMVTIGTSNTFSILFVITY